VRLLRTPLPAALVGALLAGCAAVGDDSTPLPSAAYLGLTEADRYGAAGDAPAATEADLRWWRRFDDPQLAEWVERALVASSDVALAQERLEEARALLRSAAAQRRPRLGAEAGATWNSRPRDGDRRLQPEAALTLDLDLWGGLAAAERSAAASERRAQHLAQAQRLAVAGLAARSYLEWRVALEDRRLLADGLALLREALRVVTVRVEAGLSPQLDRERALAELADTEAEHAAAGVRAGQSLAALQAVAGQRPQVAPLQATAAEMQGVPAPITLPRLQGPQPAARPIDLLHQRPDLRAAEEALLAAYADVGVAQAALRPRLRLPARVAFGAVTGAGAFDYAGATLSAVLQLLLYDGGAARAGGVAAAPRARPAAIDHRRVLLQALQQVESALLAREGAQLRIEARGRAARSAEAATRQADTLYRAGLASFLELVDAQRSALDNRRQLAQAEADTATAAVTAFEAMGLIDGAAHQAAGAAPTF
jgi:NodT family efflux transporter outer membrane factor (OMF) lipoprotein